MYLQTYLGNVHQAGGKMFLQSHGIHLIIQRATTVMRIWSRRIPAERRCDNAEDVTENLNTKDLTETANDL